MTDQPMRKATFENWRRVFFAFQERTHNYAKAPTRWLAAAIAPDGSCFREAC